MGLRRLLLGGMFLLIVSGSLLVPPAHGYVEAPMSLGAVIAQSTNIVLMRVEKVDKEKNLIIYRKVRDLKGVHNQEYIKHNIGRGGLRPNEWKPQMDWAEPGKLAVFFHNGGASETCIGTWWYQAYGGGEWWNHSHAEPFLLRSFAGNPEKLATIVSEVVAGRETIAPCMVDGNKEDLHNRRAKIQRLKVSLKLLDYNPKRDFVGWGGEDFRRLLGMPGFTHYSALTRVDPDAQAISAADIDNDSKMDLCLVGAERVVLMQNGGESLSELPLPGGLGGRTALWADYNGDGLPDLLLASPAGPRLYTNLGQGRFRDDSHVLPPLPPLAVTAAAWLDYDGDGKPDLLLAHGYHGLRLYRNIAPPLDISGSSTPKFGKWRYLGPFENNGNVGFNTMHVDEKNIDFQKEYTGKGGKKITWKERDFSDGTPNNLLLFEPPNNINAAIYLYREIEVGMPIDLPVSLGSDDTLSVWLNGQRLLHQPYARGCAPDQDRVTLKLQKGKNHYLMKICQGGGDWAFYFNAAPPEAAPPRGKYFEDVSTAVGLGPDGIGAGLKGNALAVGDVNGDGRPDVLYSAGSGMLLLNTHLGQNTTFVHASDCGIRYPTGRVAPLWEDVNGDGHLDLLVPLEEGCKLFIGDGMGKFTDASGQLGELAQPIRGLSAAVSGDFDGDGKLDLVLGCLRGCNRYFRNVGQGKFVDATEAIGLHQRVFNTQALTLVDINGDGMLDLVLTNEGQESCVLLGNPGQLGDRVAVTVRVGGKRGVLGSQVRIADRDGKVVGRYDLSGGNGRGQPAQAAHFGLAPGTYRVLVRYSHGEIRGREITFHSSARVLMDESAPVVK